QRRRSEILFDSRRVVYGRILGKLRSFYPGKQKDAKNVLRVEDYFETPGANIYEDEVKEALAEGILLAGDQLRDKLLKAENSFIGFVAGSAAWEREYGM